MKYQVKLVGGNSGIEDNIVLETDDRTDAFEMLVHVKSLQHEYIR